LETSIAIISPALGRQNIKLPAYTHEQIVYVLLDKITAVQGVHRNLRLENLAKLLAARRARSQRRCGRGRKDGRW